MRCWYRGQPQSYFAGVENLRLSARGEKETGPYRVENILLENLMRIQGWAFERVNGLLCERRVEAGGGGGYIVAGSPEKSGDKHSSA
jgi:hypothetical protein